MTERERFLRVMRYQPVDRCFYHQDWGWPETIERWKTEGFDQNSPPQFGADRWMWHGHWFFPNPPFERQVIEEDERTITYINHEGILMRERKDQPYSSMPQFLRFPVENRADFRKFWTERMKPDPAARLGANWKELLLEYKNRTIPLIVIADRWGGFFGAIRNMTGVENLCILFYDDPAFVEEMMDAVADHIIALMDILLDMTDVDVFGFWEDMGFKTGPLLGPKQVRKYMLPRYRRVVEFLRGRGVEFISLDSDGQIGELIPIWLEAGINVLYPFEVQCGMDVVAVRKKYGKDLRMWGGINKHALAEGRAAIDAELARVAPLVKEGGYIPYLDHSVPPDVGFHEYCYYMERLKEIL